MSEPDIFEYEHFRDYLRDWFDHRKATNPRYSYRLFAKRAGSTDPSLLHRVIRGRRRLPDAQVDAFCTALHLEGEAAEYFRLLVAYEQARKVVDRERAWAALIDFHARRQGPNLDGDYVRFLSGWLPPAVLAMADCPGFEADPQAIAHRFRPAVTEDQVAEVLELLFRMGLLERTDDGIRVHSPTSRTPAHVSRLGSLGYHRDNHALAGEALDRIWKRAPGAQQETVFVGVSVAIPSSRLVEFRRMAFELQGQLLSACEALEGERDVVVQLNLQAFPVSERLTDD